MGERLRRAILGLHIFDAGFLGFDRFRSSGVPKTVGEVEHDQRNGDHSQGLFLFRIVRNQRHMFLLVDRRGVLEERDGFDEVQRRRCVHAVQLEGIHQLTGWLQDLLGLNKLHATNVGRLL